MSKSVEFTANFDTFDVFERFKTGFRTNIIENGLDEPLKESAATLRADLLFLVNEKVRVSAPAKINTKNVSTQAVGQTNEIKGSIPQSQAEIIKTLTNGKVDISKYNPSKSASTITQTNIAFAHNNKRTNSASRVTLKVETTSNATLEEEYARARKYFNEAVFAIPDSSGKINYYINPGIEIADDTKVRCSVNRGTGDIPQKHGQSPEQRFNRIKKNQRNPHKKPKKEQDNPEAGESKNYAEWTLKQEALEEIKHKFVNITEVVEHIQRGDFDRAKSLLDKADKSSALPEVKQQVDKLEQGVGLSPTTKAYTDIIKLINNLKIIKELSSLERELY
jgi:hypothetical protein